MALFKDRLVEAIKMRDTTAAELSRISGVSEGLISQYKKGAFKAAQDKLDALARALRVSPGWLMGLSDDIMPKGIEPIPSSNKVPLVGVIACGDPILAIEDVSEFVDAPSWVRCDFALKCKGDSMINARIYDGDMVYIRKQDDVDTGDIAAVIIGEEATLKRVYKSSGLIILQPENPNYQPIIADKNTHIIGKAVAFTSNIR